MKAGALGPSEVEVVGTSPRLGPDYLRIRVQSGLIFDRGRAAAGDLDLWVWQHVVEPVLASLDSARFEPANLELLLAYGLQDLAATADGVIDAAGPVEERQFRVAIPEPSLTDLLAGRLEAGQLFERGRQRALPQAE